MKENVSAKKKDSVQKNEKVLAEIGDIQSYVKSVLEKSGSKEFVYRGHASEDWELKPSIGRIDGYSLKIEKEMFLRFKRNYYSYTNERPESDMDLLFLAQHYGLPTRLLDFTFNPMIALYFACESELEKDGKVYVHSMDKMLLMDADSNPKMPHSIDEVFSKKGARFVVPNYTDARYKNQKALFLLSDKPNQKFTFITESYIIKKEGKEQILRDLAKLGYDKTLVYPLLDSLCEDIRKMYKMK